MRGSIKIPTNAILQKFGGNNTGTHKYAYDLLPIRGPEIKIESGLNSGAMLAFST